MTKNIIDQIICRKTKRHRVIYLHLDDMYIEVDGDRFTGVDIYQESKRYVIILVNKDYSNGTNMKGWNEYSVPSSIPEIVAKTISLIRDNSVEK